MPGAAAKVNSELPGAELPGLAGLAVGTDAAGRRQYRYHDLWREQRDREKHDRMLEFGAALPLLRGSWPVTWRGGRCPGTM